MRSCILFMTVVLFAICDNTTAFSTSPQLSGPHFTDIIVTTSEIDLLLFGELRNSLTEDMIEGLHNGIPVRFFFFVELAKHRGNWFDKQLVSREFTHTLTYDTLKETYVVDTEESARRRRTAPSLEEAALIVNEINGLKIIELERLVPDSKYSLRIKAELHKTTLPLSLHTIIPFLGWWDVKTDWFTIEFMY
jgi:hypothetical protein